MTEVTARADPRYGRLVVVVTDPPDGAVVERDDGQGFRPIRVATLLDTPETLAVVDYEAPTDKPVAYRAGSSVAAPVVLASEGRTWWKPLPYPSLGLPVQVVSGLRVKESDTETVDQWPIGAKYPITVTGARRAWSSQLVVATMTAAEGDRFQAGLDGSALALFQPPGNQRQVYLRLGKVTRTAHTRLLGDPVAVWSIDVQEVREPVLDWGYPPTATWGTWRDSGATWATWRALSWIDVILGDAA